LAVKVVIDKQTCQSSGNCVHDDPEAFGFDDDELGDVLAAAAGRAIDGLIQIAARCPAMAIAILDAAGNEIEISR